VTAVTTPTYTVHTLRLGTIRADKSGTVHGFPPGTMLDVPIWAAAVEGGGRRFLVDTGLRDAAKWSGDSPHTITPSQMIDAALAELGWRRRDMDLIINSHLHYDHSENNLAFPQAQFFVSRTEWDFAHDPHHDQAPLYHLQWTGSDLTFENYTLVDTENYDVLPGVRLIRTPGHTPGHQSVLVQTGEGTLCVTGDAACMMENFSIPTPPGTHVARSAALESIRKISRLSDRVFMNHDPALTPYQNSSFPTPVTPPAGAPSEPKSQTVGMIDIEI
jgi:glyoxylase-like metal-dependent hydrolase (beta-lactamase superfamily II)